MTLDSDSDIEPVATSTQTSSADPNTIPSSTLKSKRPALLDMFGTPYAFRSQTHKKLTSAVTRYLCRDGLPIYTVEKEGFQDLLKAFDER